MLHLSSLPVKHHVGSGLGGELPWEEVLRAYSTSEHPWVAPTAHAWLSHLDALVPEGSVDTGWNDAPDHARAFELALRARIAWLAHHLEDSTLETDINPVVRRRDRVLRF